MQSLHLFHTLTCTELPVVKLKTRVVPPRKDKVNTRLSELNLINKVAVLRKEENYYHRSPRKS